MSQYPDHDLDDEFSDNSTGDQRHYHQHHQQNHHQQQQQIHQINTCHKHTIEKEDSQSTDGSDEDILHVVTNVYTIPILKSSKITISSDCGNGDQSFQEIHTSALPLVANSDWQNGQVNSCHLASASSMSAGESATSRVECTAAIDASASSPCQRKYLQQQQQQQQQHPSIKPIVTSKIGQEFAKSKFQIHSIVEIYENNSNDSDVEQKAGDSNDHVAFLNTNSKYDDTTTREEFVTHLNGEDGNAQIQLVDLHRKYISRYIFISNIYVPHFRTPK